jgi:hypothetical protein
MPFPDNKQQDEYYLTRGSGIALSVFASPPEPLRALLQKSDNQGPAGGTPAVLDKAIALKIFGRGTNFFPLMTIYKKAVTL